MYVLCIQQYVNRELPDVQARFRKGRGIRYQIHWIIEKAREFKENIYFCFIDYAKAFDCVDHNKLCKIFTETGIPDHLTCLLRNLYAGQEATVRTRHGTDWFQIRKGVCQGCILSPCLFNLLEKAMAPYSSTTAWKIPWIEEPGKLQSMGSLRVGHDWATSLSLLTFMHWRRKWQPTPVFLPGESQGWGSLVGCHLWGRTESDMTEGT